jgi:hypothetical protein
MEQSTDGIQHTKLDKNILLNMIYMHIAYIAYISHIFNWFYV